MSTSAFRLLILASLLLQVASALVDSVFPQLLPAELASALDNEPLPPFMEQTWFIGGLILLAALMLAGAAGLFWFKRWARPLSLGSTVAAYALLPFLGSHASSGLALALADAGAMLWGATLALAYFSPLRERFAAAADAPAHK